MRAYLYLTKKLLLLTSTLGLTVATACMVNIGGVTGTGDDNDDKTAASTGANPPDGMDVCDWLDEIFNECEDQLSGLGSCMETADGPVDCEGAWADGMDCIREMDSGIAACGDNAWSCMSGCEDEACFSACENDMDACAGIGGCDTDGGADDCSCGEDGCCAEGCPEDGGGDPDCGFGECTCGGGDCCDPGCSDDPDCTGDGGCGEDDSCNEDCLSDPDCSAPGACAADNRCDPSCMSDDPDCMAAEVCGVNGGCNQDCFAIDLDCHDSACTAGADYCCDIPNADTDPDCSFGDCCWPDDPCGLADNGVCNCDYDWDANDCYIGGTCDCFSDGCCNQTCPWSENMTDPDCGIGGDCYMEIFNNCGSPQKVYGTSGCDPSQPEAAGAECPVLGVVQPDTPLMQGPFADGDPGDIVRCDWDETNGWYTNCSTVYQTVVCTGYDHRVDLCMLQ